MEDDTNKFTLSFQEENQYSRADFTYKFSGGSVSNAVKFNVWVAAIVKEDYESKLALSNALHDLKTEIDSALEVLGKELEK